MDRRLSQHAVRHDAIGKALNTKHMEGCKCFKDGAHLDAVALARPSRDLVDGVALERQRHNGAALGNVYGAAGVDVVAASILFFVLLVRGRQLLQERVLVGRCLHAAVALPCTGLEAIVDDRVVLEDEEKGALVDGLGLKGAQHVRRCLALVELFGNEVRKDLIHVKVAAKREVDACKRGRRGLLEDTACVWLGFLALLVSHRYIVLVKKAWSSIWNSRLTHVIRPTATL